MEKARPVSAAEKAMIDEAAKRQNEELLKKQLGARHWVHDVSFRESLEMLCSLPTVNIEGSVAGYTGPGGKTILPHRAVAKLDLRLVPDMTAADALAKLKAHLASRGFGDIGADSALNAQHVFINAQQFNLGFVGIGYETAVEYDRGARNLRDTGCDHSTGTGFRNGDFQVQ